MAEGNAVSLKLPAFWSHQPRVWFAQAEAQFALRNITADETKYHYLVAALPEEVATRVLDQLEANPAADRYKGLKDRLLATFTLSEYERAGILIDGPSLGDEKPSALMDKMLSVLGNHEPCFLFRRLFLQRLPASIRGPLLHSGEKDMRTLAGQADLLWQAGHTSSIASTVSELAPAEANKVERPSSKSSNSAFKKWREAWQQSPGGPCAYHSYYGAQARQCSLPCSSKQAGNASAGR